MTWLSDKWAMVKGWMGGLYAKVMEMIAGHKLCALIGAGLVAVIVLMLMGIIAF